MVRLGHWLRRHWKTILPYYLLLGLVGTVWVAAFGTPTGSDQFDYIGMICLVSFCVLPVLLLSVWFVWFVMNATENAINEAAVAIQPLPSPPEIAWGLQQEWGRSPTTEEVYAVHRMLHDRRNEALVTAGVSFGALYLLTRHGH